jgi:dinuclear metal center YbgI/SA1388 family protein
MKISEIIQLLESLAPPVYQEDYDNSGLITGDHSITCSGVLVSLDCTEDVIREAVEKKCNLVVSHHPLIFHPLKKIYPDNATGRALLKAIREEIAVYSIHTNLDNIITGVNGCIADRLDLENRRILLPKTEFPEVGSGIIGELKIALTENQFLELLKKKFNLAVIRHSPLCNKPVTRVAVCGGAGSFLISKALQMGADFFVSADIKYHEFFGAEDQMVIADIGHFESEQFTIDLLHDIILEKFPNFAVLKSGSFTNPVKYYI